MDWIKRKKRRLLSLAMSLVMILTMLPVTAFAADIDFAGGDGSVGNPYRIATAAQLDNVRNNLSANYILMNDIDLGGQQWTPIGTFEIPFAGIFDGQGHGITGLAIGTDSQYSTLPFAGLFSFTASGSLLKNLSVSGAVYSADMSAFAISGLLVAVSNGRITNCSSSGSLTASIGGFYLGGLVGYAIEGDILNSFSTADVTVTGNHSGFIGGLIGQSHVVLNGCRASGDVTGGNNSYAGGLIGMYLDGNISGCFANGDVVTGYGSITGGLIGYASGPVDNCYATGDINIRDNGNVGGLIGTAGDMVINCYATGYITAGPRFDGNHGGLIGKTSGPVNNCYATGAYLGGTALSPLSPSGIAGTNVFVIQLYYEDGDMWVSAETGLPIENSYWNSDVARSGIGYTGIFIPIPEFVPNIDITTGMPYSSMQTPGFAATLNGNIASDSLPGCLEWLQTPGRNGGLPYLSGVGDAAALPVTAEPGGAACSTRLTAAAAPGHTLAYALSSSAFTAPGIGDYPVKDGLYAATYTSGSDIAGVAAGDHIALMELDGKGAVAAFSQITLTDAQIYIPALPVPSGLGWSGRTAVWDAAPNASGYRVQLYEGGAARGDPVSAFGTSYDFSEVLAAAGAGSYSFTVSAVGDGVNFLNGGASEPGPDCIYDGVPAAPVIFAPAIAGPTAMTLNSGYNAVFTDSYTITGTSPVTVTKISGDNKITWNDAAKKLHIAEGLAEGSYPVVLTAGNAASPDATLTFILTVDSEFAGGNGSAESPFHIRNAVQLNNVRNHLDANFVLDNDVDLRAACAPGGAYYYSGCGWAPIGSYDFPFTGTLDGGGHTIAGLAIRRANMTDVGLFGDIFSGGAVQNLTLKDIFVFGYKTVGGLVGFNEGTITGCAVIGSSLVGANRQTAGGLIGNNAGVITNSYVLCNVDGRIMYGGGLAGYNGSAGSVANCYTVGIVHGSADTGGLLGQNNGAAVTGCYYDKTVSGMSDNDKGTPLYTADMMKRSSYTDWDFTGVWRIVENYTYPILRCQPESAAEIDAMIASDLNALAIGYAAGDSADSVTGSLTLSPAGANGTSITWSSSDPSVISDDGTFTRPAGAEKTVTLTATVSKPGGTGRTKLFILTVINTQAPPILTGPTAMTLSKSYAAASTGVYTVKSAAPATVTKTSGDGKITWNDTAKRLDIAEGLAEGSYSVILTAGNGFLPDATLTFTLTVIPEFEGGDGSAEAPYHIRAAEQLNNVRNYPNANFVLDNDIDLTAVCAPGGVYYNDGAGWAPIGSYAVPFTGVLNGNGHTITGLFIDRTAGDVGLFGDIFSGGAVQNLTLRNVSVTGNTTVGSLAGFNGGTVISCGVLGFSSVRANVQTAGGLIGNNGGVLANSYALCNVNSTGTYGGGLAGYSNGGITNCYAAGIVNGSGDTGGLLGKNNGGTVTGCYYDSAVSGKSDTGKGTPLSTADMMKQASYTGWDFTNVWYINEGASYPYLRPVLTGAGTQSDPYRITTPEELNAMRCDLGSCYVLANDIDLAAYLSPSGAGYNGGKGWVPVGGEASPFTGTLDGNGHSVSGLKITGGTAVYVGLFGYIGSGGAARSLRLTDVSIRFADVANSFIGALAGCNSGTISDCGVSGSISAGSAGNSGYPGGICGTNRGTVIRSRNSAVILSFFGDAGGIASNNFGTISQCYNTGSVSGTVSQGGIAGYSDSDDGMIVNCYNTASVSGTGSLGGIVGYNGSFGPSVTNCYASGAVADNGAHGGIAGQNYGSVTGCFYSTRGTGQSDTGKGTPLSAADMKKSSSFASWDFTNIWAIREGISYPYLRFTADEIPPLIEVTVSWGSMEFTYSDGTWNPQTHEYEGGGWTVDENANRISVTSTSDVPVTVTYSYAPETGYSDVIGSFTDGTNPLASRDLPAGDTIPQSCDAFLALSNKPPEMSVSKIGSVTVTITVTD